MITNNLALLLQWFPRATTRNFATFLTDCTDIPFQVSWLSQKRNPSLLHHWFRFLYLERWNYFRIKPLLGQPIMSVREYFSLLSDLQEQLTCLQCFWVLLQPHKWKEFFWSEMCCCSLIRRYRKRLFKKLRRNASVVALGGTPLSNPRDSSHHSLNPRCSPIMLPGVLCLGKCCLSDRMCSTGHFFLITKFSPPGQERPFHQISSVWASESHRFTFKQLWLKFFMSQMSLVSSNLGSWTFISLIFHTGHYFLFILTNVLQQHLANLFLK